MFLFMYRIYENIKYDTYAVGIFSIQIKFNECNLCWHHIYKFVIYIPYADRATWHYKFIEVYCLGYLYAADCKN